MSTFLDCVPDVPLTSWPPLSFLKLRRMKLGQTLNASPNIVSHVLSVLPFWRTRQQRFGVGVAELTDEAYRGNEEE